VITDPDRNREWTVHLAANFKCSEGVNAVHQPVNLFANRRPAAQGRH
jgi:hypothetical protein